jgi:hypothetical protein
MEMEMEMEMEMPSHWVVSMETREALCVASTALLCLESSLLENITHLKLHCF